MNFDPGEEASAFAESVRRFARRELAPHYQQGDRVGALAPGVVAKMAAAGLLGLRVPPALGGQGADAVTTGLAIEAVAAADFNAAYLVLVTALCGEVVAAAPEPDADWLRAVADGRSVPCLAVTEPDHGSDTAALELRAAPAGDGYLLDGDKTSVSLGTMADTAVVLARTGGPGAGGVTAFTVDLHHPGLQRTPFRDLGSHAIGRASLHFEGVPTDRRLGGEGEGFTRIMQGFDYSRALIGLMCVAAAQASLEEALGWATQRRAFGQPIGRFQGVAFPLVEQATFLRAARLLCFEALWSKDVGADPAVPANMAKWWAPAAAVQAAHQALLTFGHTGYSEDLPLAQRLRDLVGLEIGDGTAQVAKLVVARHLLGRSAAP